MVVLTVVGMLMAFAAPNIFSLVQARTLTAEGGVLRNQLTYAQQIAMAQNADVEIRFFKWTDLSSAQIEPVFSAFQLYQYDSTGKMKPISTFFKIRAPSALSEPHSTLLQPGFGADSDEGKYGFLSPRSGQAPAPTGSGSDKADMDYVAFRFRPDGSTDLPAKAGKDTWYLTLVQGEGAARDTSLPRNYVCLQVNPYNGAVSEFRP